MRISTDHALLQPSFTSISSARARPSSRAVPPSCSWSASRASTLVHAHVRSFFSSRTHLVFLVVVQQHVCHVVELGFAIHGHVMCANGAWFVGNRAAPHPLVPTSHPRRSRYDHRDLLGKDAKERSRSRRGSEANPTDRSHPRSLVGGVVGGTVKRPSMDWKDRRDARRRRCRTSPACGCGCDTPPGWLGTVCSCTMDTCMKPTNVCGERHARASERSTWNWPQRPIQHAVGLFEKQSKGRFAWTGSTKNAPMDGTTIAAPSAHTKDGCCNTPVSFCTEKERASKRATLPKNGSIPSSLSVP